MGVHKIAVESVVQSPSGGHQSLRRQPVVFSWRLIKTNCAYLTIDCVYSFKRFPNGRLNVISLSNKFNRRNDRANVYTPPLLNIFHVTSHAARYSFWPSHYAGKKYPAEMCVREFKDNRAVGESAIWSEETVLSV